jgi:hypothetical protein
MNAKKIAPKIMRIVSENLNKETVSNDVYFKILGLVYNIEDEIEKSKEKNNKFAFIKFIRVIFFHIGYVLSV